MSLDALLPYFELRGNENGHFVQNAQQILTKIRERLAIWQGRSGEKLDSPWKTWFMADFYFKITKFRSKRENMND